MKRKVYIHSILAGLLVLTACQNFLDVKPKGKVIPETDEEFMAVLSNMLYNIETCQYSGNVIIPGPAEVLDFEAITDNLDANLEDLFTTAKSGLPLYQGSEINKCQTYWANLFEAVRNCNIILDEMKLRSTETARELCAACYSIKAVCYYHLLRAFCEPYSPSSAPDTPGLPIVDEFDIESVPQRSSLAVSAAYTVALFETAIGYHVADDKFIFTEDICRAYLAKTLFWMQDWDRTIALCEELLPRYPLTGYGDYSSMIQDLNKRQGEIIVRSYTKGDNTNIYYTNARTSASRRPINKTLIDLFGAEPEKDIRYSVSVGARRMNAKRLGGRLRSSELCLMLAESYAHKGEDGKALEQLNLLRANRISGAVDYTPETLPAPGGRLITEDAEGKALTPLMSAIFDERRKEFFLEGDRWFELKRNGRPLMKVISNSRKYVTYPYLYTFPINRRDVDLGGVEQNPGYVY